MITHSRAATAAFLFIFSVAFYSCKQHKAVSIERGFYYWKNSESLLNASEIAAVKELGVKKLYVKFFEIEFNGVFGIRPNSKASVNFHYSDNAAVLNNARIIPVVYIKNDVLTNTKPEDIQALADNIVFLVKKRYREQIDFNNSLTEIQIDCDWTASTKDRYFLLLKSIKNISGEIISCTLRMYPYKYPDIMGVPPVDKVTLMCYNLNNPLENENKNSILDVAELKKYLDTKKTYPLQLDIVLPLTSWMLCFQNNQFTGILHNQDNIHEIAMPIKPFWYSVTKDTILDDIFLRTGDKIKYEEVGKEQLAEVIRLLKSRLNFSASTTISFFHLDKTSLNKYGNETLDNLYNRFN